LPIGFVTYVGAVARWRSESQSPSPSPPGWWSFWCWRSAPSAT